MCFTTNTHLGLDFTFNLGFYTHSLTSMFYLKFLTRELAKCYGTVFVKLDMITPSETNVAAKAISGWLDGWDWMVSRWGEL